MNTGWRLIGSNLTLRKNNGTRTCALLPDLFRCWLVIWNEMKEQCLSIDWVMIEIDRKTGYASGRHCECISFYCQSRLIGGSDAEREILVKRHRYTVYLRKSWQLFIEQGDVSCGDMSEGKFKEKPSDLCDHRNVPRSRVREESMVVWNERRGMEKRKSPQLDRTKEMTSPLNKA